MTQGYQAIIQYEEDNFEEFLERLCLIDIFLPVIKAYPDRDTLKCVIRYIVYSYSLNSEKIVLGMDWQKNKQKIFEDVLAKPEKGIYEDLVLLKNEAVLQSINSWMEHQDSDSFKMLQVLRDLRIEMQLSANAKIIKSSGEIDYSQKFLNAEYANKLKAMIKDLENELIQNNPLLKESVREVKVETNKKNSRSVGSYAVE